MFLKMKKLKRSNFHLILNNSRDGVLQIIFSFLTLQELTELLTINKQFYASIDYRLTFAKFPFKQVFQGDNHGVYCDTIGYTIAEWPCKSLLLKLVKYESFNYNDFNDYTLLFSLYNHYHNVFDYLIEHGNVNIHCWNDKILEILCERGFIKKLKLILKNVGTISNDELIKIASIYGNFEIVEYLLTKNGVKLTDNVMNRFLDIKRFDLFKKYLNHPTYVISNQFFTTILTWGYCKAAVYLLENKIIDITTVNNLDEINISSFIANAIETNNIKALVLVNNELSVCEIDTDVLKIYNGLKGNKIVLNHFLHL